MSDSDVFGCKYLEDVEDRGSVPVGH